MVDIVCTSIFYSSKRICFSFNLFDADKVNWREVDGRRDAVFTCAKTARELFTARKHLLVIFGGSAGSWDMKVLFGIVLFVLNNARRTLERNG